MTYGEGSLHDLLKKIDSGEAEVIGVGNAPVTPGANADEMLAAVENASVAQEFSAKGLALARSGHLEEALVALYKSVAMEESVGNTWGIASDLGNIGECHRQLKQWKQAEVVFMRARALVQDLLKQCGASHSKVPAALEFADYCEMYGKHSEGLARVLIAMGRKKEAVSEVQEAIEGYVGANNVEGALGARKLQAWLSKQL